MGALVQLTEDHCGEPEQTVEGWQGRCGRPSNSWRPGFLICLWIDACGSYAGKHLTRHGDGLPLH